MHESFFTSHFGRNEKKLTKKNAELKRRIELNRCRDCGEKPDNSIVSFDIEHRKRVYK